MKHEKNNMEITHTWDLVPPDPSIKPVSSGWVYKSKFHADGTLDKRKSLLVARGNEQEEGVDFFKTYSPVVRTATIRSVLHVATVKRWQIKQLDLDVENAFLHGDLEETVYMKQPPGLEDPEKPDYLCKLRNNLHVLGLISSARFSSSLDSNVLMLIRLCLCIIMVLMSSILFSTLMICSSREAMMSL